jgi:hypothetical protein
VLPAVTRNGLREERYELDKLLSLYLTVFNDTETQNFVKRRPMLRHIFRCLEARVDELPTFEWSRYLMTILTLQFTLLWHPRDQLVDLTLGSKLKTVSHLSGHSNPHLHVPCVCRYSFRWSNELSAVLLGLKQRTDKLTRGPLITTTFSQGIIYCSKHTTCFGFYIKP